MESISYLLETIHAINSGAEIAVPLKRYLNSVKSSQDVAILLMRTAISARNKKAVVGLDVAYGGPLLMTSLFGSPDEDKHCSEEELKWVTAIGHRRASALYGELSDVACYRQNNYVRVKFAIIKRLAPLLPLPASQWEAVKKELPQKLHEKLDKVAAKHTVAEEVGPEEKKVRVGELLETLLKSVLSDTKNDESEEEECDCDKCKESESPAKESESSAKETDKEKNEAPSATKSSAKVETDDEDDDRSNYLAKLKADAARIQENLARINS